MTFSGSVAPSPILQLIENGIQRLRSLTDFPVQENWSVLAEDLIPQPLAQERSQPPVTLNSRNHIAWPKGKQCLWLGQTFQWPSHVNGFSVAGYRAKLALRWWADFAGIYVNGECIQTGDLFDCFTRITLSTAVEPGESVSVALQLISPGHDEGALVKSNLIFESPNDTLPEPSFVADELAVLYRYLKQFAPDQLDTLAEQIQQLAWPTGEGPEGSCDRFLISLAQVRQQLTIFSDWIKQRHIHCLGHAHLDLAWLWPIADTWEAAERTFRSVLTLQQDFPELTYTHSSPALFAWLEDNRPKLFQTIQQQVKQGTWAIDAGLWVEPELNLINGESIVRQILYGQRYCQEKFGQISPIAWLPDTFGFCWQLPQLLTQGGIRYFATQKLRWNDTNPFPHNWFWWEGLEGTRIQSLTLPLIGSDIDPVEMADYACGWEVSTGHLHSLWLPGVGDHGGGPTRDMLEKARRWAKSPFFPQLNFSPIVDFLQKLESDNSSCPSSSPSKQQLTSQDLPADSSQLPVWRDELYLELHRGCYTTHADQKWYNRRCEDLLYQAELFSSIATLVVGQDYPKAKLEAGWKNTLFNQFHDILPGSSIPEVFTEANQLWQQVLQLGNDILQEALETISALIDIPAPPHINALPLIIFNPLNWPRTELVAVPISPSAQAEQFWQISDLQGNPLITQIVQDAPSEPHLSYPPTVSETCHLLFEAKDIPSIGYRVFWLLPTSRPVSLENPGPCPNSPSHWSLENTYLKASVDPLTGNLCSLYDKQQNREILNGAGNELQAFKDQGQYWDAWNIAPDYQSYPEPAATLLSIRWIEKGPLRQRVQVARQLGQSTFQQDYILEANSPLLKIRTRINWQETQVFVKAAFPHNLQVSKMTCEIAFGAIERPTVPQTPEESAKWEVPALAWVDISQPDYGLSILTDSKHGFDIQANCLRLSLLKSPLWPDPTTDRGYHQTHFALYPHCGTWNTALSTHFARAFNIPLRVHVPSEIVPRSPKKKLPNEHSFLEICSPSRLILSALKQSEEQLNKFVARFYEPYGQASHFEIINNLDLNVETAVDFLETIRCSKAEGSRHPHRTTLPISSWQVVSLSLISKAH